MWGGTDWAWVVVGRSERGAAAVAASRVVPRARKVRREVGEIMVWAWVWVWVWGGSVEMQELAGGEEGPGVGAPGGEFGVGGWLVGEGFLVAGDEEVGGFEFVGGRWALEAALVGGVHALGFVGDEDEVVGEGFGLGVEERVIQEEEGLSGDRALVAARGAGVGVGSIEQGEKRVALDALGHEVDAAAGGIVDRLERGMLGEVPGFFGRERVRATGGAVEVAADEQEGVADFLGLESAAGEGGVVEMRVGGCGREGGEAEVGAGVGVGVGVGWGGGALVGGAAHDFAVQGLEAPAVTDQGGGEVIEQLGVGRGRAAGPKVVGGGDEADPEMAEPDAIGDDAWGEWVVGGDEPLGELETAAGVGVLEGLAAEQLEVSAEDGFAGLFRVAAFLESGVGRFAFGDGVGEVGVGFGGWSRRVGAVGWGLGRGRWE